MKKKLFLGLLCLTVLTGCQATEEKGDDVSGGNNGNKECNNPLVCSSIKPEYDEYYMAMSSSDLIYDYDDTNTTVLSLTSHYYIEWDKEVLEGYTEEDKEAARKEIEKEECLSGGREYSGVDLSCEVSWKDERTVVVEVKWDIENPELDFGQDLPRNELKNMLENESEFAGEILCK